MSTNHLACKDNEIPNSQNWMTLPAKHVIFPHTSLKFQRIFSCLTVEDFRKNNLRKCPNIQILDVRVILMLNKTA